MSRKLYAGLAPLLAVIAVGAMPAVSQATEFHWYSNGTRLAFESGGKVTKVAIKTHSTTAGLSLEALGNKITCTVKDTGNIWNTTLGAPGQDEVLTFENSACAPSVPPCETGETVELIAAGLPWKTHLAGGQRDVIEGIHIEIVCNKAGTKTVKDVFSGTLSTKIHNGTTGTEAGCTAETDTYTEFDTASGTLEDPAKNKATAVGRDCIWGSAGGEVITVKSP